MNIAKEFWRYWKWLCVALMTTFVVLAILAAVIDRLKPAADPSSAIKACLESGGSWDESGGECRNAA